MQFIQISSAACAHTAKAMALLFVFLVLLFSPLAWSQQFDTPDSSGMDDSASVQQLARQAGSISGKVVDQAGAHMVGPLVTLLLQRYSSHYSPPSHNDL